MAIEKFTLSLVNSERVTPNVLHISFRRTDSKVLDFVPGQFITFLFPGENKPKRRSYSVATIPGTVDTIDIAISYVEDGVASEVLFNAKPGDCFDAMGPAGRLIMMDDPDIDRYVLVATGTGVAPYRAMLPELAKRFTERPDFKAHVLLGVQYQADLLYAEDFREFAEKHPQLTFHAYLSRDAMETPKPDEYKGYVQHAFDGLALQADRDIVYLCGNPNMIDDAFAWLVDKGFATKTVRREKYISSN